MFQGSEVKMVAFQEWLLGQNDILNRTRTPLATCVACTHVRSTYIYSTLYHPLKNKVLECDGKVQRVHDMQSPNIRRFAKGYAL